METRKQLPLGVSPRWLWDEQHPDPSLAELSERFEDVNRAIVDYRAAGISPYFGWLYEVMTGQDVTAA